MKETVERRQEMKERESGTTLESKYLLHGYDSDIMRYIFTIVHVHFILLSPVINMACSKGQTCSLKEMRSSKLQSVYVYNIT